jgi:hypothetical protein
MWYLSRVPLVLQAHLQTKSPLNLFDLIPLHQNTPKQRIYLFPKTLTLDSIELQKKKIHQQYTNPSTYWWSAPKPLHPSSRSPQLRFRSPLGFSLLPSNQLHPSLSFSSPTPLGQSSFSAHQATFPSPGPIQLVRGKVPFYFFPLPFPHPPHLIHWFVPHHLIRCSVLPSPSFTSFHQPFPLTPFPPFPFFLLPTFLFSFFINNFSFNNNSFLLDFHFLFYLFIYLLDFHFNN